MALPAPSRSQQPDLPRLLRQASRAHQEGALAKAERLYAALLAHQPSNFDALRQLGLLKYQRGELDDAARFIAMALKTDQRSSEAWSNLGRVLHAQRRLSEALQSYDAAIAIAADRADILNDRGTVLHQLGRSEEAIESFGRALAFRPDFVLALYNRGNALLDLNRWDEALASFDQALAVDPGHAESLCLRGNALVRLNRLEDAVRAYDAALQVAPDHPVILLNHAYAHRHLGRPDLALASSARGLAIKPDHAGLWFGHSLALLALGDFENGWKAYEWRWLTAEFMPHRRQFPQPLWLGAEPIAGKTLLLHAEQGYGDTLQFIRYAALAAHRGAKVILEAPPELATLLASMHAIAGVVPRGAPLPPFDLHCPLASLPLAFGTALASIPASVPYLEAPERKAAMWRERLPPGTPRVGLVWSGRSTHSNDRNRSIGFERLGPLLEMSNIRFVSLQPEVRREDAAALRNCPSIVDIGRELQTFADTAAVIAALDLVISVDTAVVHLAGALGRPVFVLLPVGADFRWLLGRDDSPWYPTARLFRQPRIGDWDSVIAQVRGQLEGLPSAA